MKFTLKGIIPAMVTPLTPEGEVNEKSLRQFVRYLIEGGVHGIFAAGTTGEFYGLSKEQHRTIIEITVDAVKKRVPVYAGAAAITTKEAVELSKIAQDAGADAVSILTPFFLAPSQKELICHYTTIASSVNLPIIMYNNQPKTQVTLTPDTVEKLADVENIVGIKDSTGDFTLTSEYIRRTRNKGFSVLAGRDTLIHAALCYGGAGAIASCANVAPRLCADIYDKYVAGDRQGSLEAQYRLAPLRIAFNIGTFPAVIKESLTLLGIDAGPCMSPAGPMTYEERARLKEVLIEMDLLH